VRIDFELQRTSRANEESGTRALARIKSGWSSGRIDLGAALATPTGLVHAHRTHVKRKRWSPNIFSFERTYTTIYEPSKLRGQ
jgi:hypothetical protein